MKPLAGFDPLPSADWPEIAAGLARPWSDAACRHDLRWHAMQERVHGKRFPGRPYFMGRWTRPEWDVRLIFRSDWRDPMYPAKLSSDSPAALQPDSSRTPAAATANAENAPKSSSRTPAALQPDSGNPPSRGSSSPITDHRSPGTHIRGASPPRRRARPPRPTRRGGLPTLAPPQSRPPTLAGQSSASSSRRPVSSTPRCTSRGSRARPTRRRADCEVKPRGRTAP